jgi:hypothetical protein
VPKTTALVKANKQFDMMMYPTRTTAFMEHHADAALYKNDGLFC